MEQLLRQKDACCSKAWIGKGLGNWPPIAASPRTAKAGKTTVWMVPEPANLTAIE